MTDFVALVEIARRQGIPLNIDNTVPLPFILIVTFIAIYKSFGQHEQ